MQKCFELWQNVEKHLYRLLSVDITQIKRFIFDNFLNDQPVKNCEALSDKK
jgi:hypothetical protein